MNDYVTSAYCRYCGNEFEIFEWSRDHQCCNSCCFETKLTEFNHEITEEWTEEDLDSEFDANFQGDIRCTVEDHRYGIALLEEY